MQPCGPAYLNPWINQGDATKIFNQRGLLAHAYAAAATL